MSADKCSNAFNNALDLYKKVFIYFHLLLYLMIYFYVNYFQDTRQMSAHFVIADKVNPLFSEFHYFDLKYIICLSEFNFVKDLRYMFENKLQKNQNKFNSSQSLVAMNQMVKSQSLQTSVKQKQLVFRAKNFGSNLSLQSTNDGSGDNISKNRQQIVRTKLERIGQKLYKNYPPVSCYEMFTEHLSAIITLWYDFQNHSFLSLIYLFFILL